MTDEREPRHVFVTDEREPRRVFVTDERESKPQRSVPSTMSPRQAPELVRALVTLHVYDLGKTASIQMTNGVLRALGSGGVFHCGVEVHGREWSYEDTGVFCVEPRQCEEHTYHEALPMGETWMSALDVVTLIDRLEADAWVGPLYDTLAHNCCHFCSDFCRRLGVGDIPPRLQELARKGVAVFAALENWRAGIYNAGLGDPLVCCCAQTSDLAALRKRHADGGTDMQGYGQVAVQVHPHRLFADLPQMSDERRDKICLVGNGDPSAHGHVHARASQPDREPVSFFHRVEEAGY